MERSAHRAKGIAPDRFQGTDLSDVTRYDLMAAAIGCHGEHVTTIDELGPALERAVASGKPAVLHVRVDPEVNAALERLRPLGKENTCLLYTSPSPRDRTRYRMPSSA